MKSLPRKADEYFLAEYLAPRFDPSNVVGFDPTASSGDSVLRNADSFEKLGDTYPQFVAQAQGETSGGESTYDYITGSGVGQNRTGTITVDIRVEDTDDSSGYTTTREYGEDTYGSGTYEQYNTVSAERLAVLIRNEIERVCLDNPTGGDTDFTFVGSNSDQVSDETNSTLPTRRESITISYGWLRD